MYVIHHFGFDMISPLKDSDIQYFKIKKISEFSLYPKKKFRGAFYALNLHSHKF